MIENTTFGLTPRELRLHIFGYLTAKELLVSATVSQMFQAMSQDEILWRDLCNRDFQIDETDSSWKVTYRDHANPLFISNLCLDFLKYYHVWKYSRNTYWFDQLHRARKTLFHQFKIKQRNPLMSYFFGRPSEYILAQKVFSSIFLGYLESYQPRECDSKPEFSLIGRILLIPRPWAAIEYCSYQRISFLFIKNVEWNEFSERWEAHCVLISFPSDLEIKTRRQEFLWRECRYKLISRTTYSRSEVPGGFSTFYEPKPICDWNSYYPNLKVFEHLREVFRRALKKCKANPSST